MKEKYPKTVPYQGKKKLGGTKSSAESEGTEERRD